MTKGEHRKLHYKGLFDFTPFYHYSDELFAKTEIDKTSSTNCGYQWVRKVHR